MSDEVERLVAEIPTSLKYLVDEDDRTNKEIVIAALETELGVSSQDSVAVIERQIKRLEDELEEEKSRLETRRENLRTVQQKLERAREVREEKIENGESYADRLDEVLDEMEAGEHGAVDARHGVIDGLREQFDRSKEEIHLDLQQRAGRQERPLSVAAFMDARFADREDEQTPISAKWTQESDNDE